MGHWSSYCTVDEILRLLGPYDLSRLGDNAACEQAVKELLATTRSIIESEAGRDFGFHANDEILIDGTGTALIDVGERTACTPLLTVKSLSINGEEVAASEYVVYATEGVIRLTGNGLWSSFSKGLQNVCVVADWGYVQSPTPIRLAQAKLTAAMLLAECSGDGAGLERLRIGDYEVAYGDGGQYSTQVKAWVEQAQATARGMRSVRIMSV